MLFGMFEEDGTFYSQLCLDDCLYEVSMLDYNRIDISEGIDVPSTQPRPCFLFESHGDPQISYRYRALFNLAKIW